MPHLGMQRPINPFLTFNADVDFGLPPARNRRREHARRALIANAIVGAWIDSPAIHYSRDNNHYSDRTSWLPDWYSRRNIVEELEILLLAGLVHCKNTAPSSTAEYRSQFSATPELMKRAPFTGIADLAEITRPPVEIRDRNTHQVIRTAAWPARQRRLVGELGEDVLAQNALLGRSRIELRPGSYGRTKEGLTAIGRPIINPLQRSLRRLFTDNLLLGGRWYGGWWQNIPKRARSSLLIDGETTIEVDFSACQLRLAYGIHGLPDPMHGEVDQSRVKKELYDVREVDRDLAKQAFLIMINALDRVGAERALAKWLHDEDEISWSDGAFAEAQRAVCAVSHHFSALRGLFFTDLGLGLQRIDGDICAEVQRIFRARQIPVLSVHDSFIVAKPHEADLRRVMMSAFMNGMAAAQRRGKCAPTRSDAA